MQFLGLLRQRHLALLWVGQVLSALGDTLYDIAVLWLAVQVAGASGGLVVAAGRVARFLCGMPGGVFADRWNRPRTMIAVDLLRGALVLLPVPLLLRDQLQLWHLAVVSIGVNALATLFDPALQAGLPELVHDRDELHALNGLMDGTRRLALTVGPGCAGLLIAVLPLAQFFTINAVSYLLSAGTILLILRHFVPQQAAATAAVGLGWRQLWQEIAGAVQLVRAHHALAYGIITNSGGNLAWSAAFMVGVPLLASQKFAGDIGLYGLLVAAYGAGNIASNLAIGSLRVRRPLLLLIGGRMMLGVGFLVLAAAPTVPLALVGSALAAVGGPMGDIVLLTMMQRDLPAGQIGKVYALRMTTATAGMSLGLVLAGPLYAIFSVAVGIALCAVVLIITGVVGLVRFGFLLPTPAARQVE